MPEEIITGGDSGELADPDPRSVAGYKLLRRIGSGGMSTVFLSYDVDSARPVAVKLLADHLAHSREYVSRFYREARLSRLLSHVNLVQGMAAGYDPDAGSHYLILEFVDGPTAHTVLNRLGRFPVGLAVKIGLDIAQALSFLHSRQYIHRDVKPDNILLHPDGMAKLADLGLAKRLNDDAHLTSISQGVGTSYYMPYEQSLNANLVDGRSDIFALGATLYHLLAGEVPFPGSTHEEINQCKHDDIFQPLRKRNPDVPPVVTEIIARMLVRDPRSRFQSVDELAAALEATGLATPLPSFPLCDEQTGSNTGTRGFKSDAPTRADLKALDKPEDLPEIFPDSHASFCGKTTGNPQGLKKELPGGNSRFVMGVLAIASAIGMGGLLASRSNPFSSQSPPVTSHHDRTDSGKGGIPMAVPH